MSLIMVIITQIYFRAVSNNVLIEIVRTTQANSQTINTQLRLPVKEFSHTLANAVNPVQTNTLKYQNGRIYILSQTSLLHDSLCIRPQLQGRSGSQLHRVAPLACCQRTNKARISSPTSI